MAGGASAGSSRAFRLDPYALPIRYSAVVGGERDGRASIVLDHRQATVSWGKVAGRPTIVTLPLSAYEGVAVRIETATAGPIRGVVELMHDDPALTLPLVIADEPDDISADWQAWGRVLNLPLLLISHDGKVVNAGRIGGLDIHPAKARRRHSYFAARRPRFLTRRKTGRADKLEVLKAREIIAPE